MSDCTHDDIVSWRFEDGAPAGMWSCQDCKYRFVPITELMRAEDELTAAKAEVEALRKAARKAVLALAHASEARPGLYADAYEAVSAALTKEKA
jgi:hypothetical protein